MMLVSACLAGIDCAWDGKDRLAPRIKHMVEKGLAVAVCPEVLGGRPIPRTRTEIRGGSGGNVLDGMAKVFDENSKDVTKEFLIGAHKALDIVEKHNIKKAILKSRSPSCGCDEIYDGSFQGRLVRGDGVTAALLKRKGVSCQNI
ncbi:MAG: DUF523 domain-containing protein [Candidatus Omnitrophica bacterium]|nr:DUF523 domain-containing protein [Candidatus Omnitrophota bacterium]